LKAKCKTLGGSRNPGAVIEFRNDGVQGRYASRPHACGNGSYFGSPAIGALPTGVRRGHKSLRPALDGGGWRSRFSIALAFARQVSALAHNAAVVVSFVISFAI
jgi:hypothetical protein